YNGDANFPTSESTVWTTVLGQTLSIGNIQLDSTISKGGIAGLSGHVANLDGAGFTLNVTWGPNQGYGDAIVYAPGQSSFSLTHHYVDSGFSPFVLSYPDY